MIDEEKRELEQEIEKIKKMISDYLRVSPILGKTEDEINRTIDFYLDDILYRQKKLKNE